MEIKINCTGTIELPYTELHDFQEDIKIITLKNLNKLKESIIINGIKAPTFIWKNRDKYWILDGHQRNKAYESLADDGYEVPNIPCVEIFAKTKKEAKQTVLLFISQHGDIKKSLLTLYIEKYKLKTERIMLRSGRIELNDDKDSIYTNKVKSPYYEIKGKKPKFNEMINLEKTNQLIEKIKNSDILDEDKRILLIAAQRHTVFNYEAIAEYYAHADKKVQSLMEDSALIIIDYDKAILNGYVKLTSEIGKNYDEE